MNTESDHDVAIVGGGLAGLSTAIQLVKSGHSIILFEKEKYPFHRVCGEYISMESWDHLNKLGVDLKHYEPPIIRHLHISNTNGRSIREKLPLGGFGMSRFFLDNKLADVARASGVTILENTRVNDIDFDDSGFSAHCADKIYKAKIICGSFGKRSNLDIKWKRPFTLSPKNKLNNYIGVKYHVKTNFQDDTIALHFFKNGYCGISKIEEDKFNLCYMTTADNLQQSGGDIGQMEQTILSENPFLKEIFQTSKKWEQEPVTISQISFDKKKPVENHILMTGDSAGMITPLCGNGMSMAFHSSKLAAENIHFFLSNKISREKMEEQYAQQWQKQFSGRLSAGRRIQRLTTDPFLMNLLLRTGSAFPPLVKWIIRQTHGDPF